MIIHQFSNQAANKKVSPRSSCPNGALTRIDSALINPFFKHLFREKDPASNLVVGDSPLACQSKQ
jgi:hypothetical protein